MRVALVGVTDPLATSLGASLGARHQVTAVADSSDRYACAAAASCDVVVHGCPAGDAVRAVDRATRGTWNILTTTRASRFVQLSSMRVFDGYPPGWAIDEGWIPRLNPDPVPLAAHLGELTAREMSRTCSVERVAYADYHRDGFHGYFYTPQRGPSGHLMAAQVNSVIHIAFRCSPHIWITHCQAYRAPLQHCVVRLLPDPLLRTEGIPSTARVTVTR